VPVQDARGDELEAPYAVPTHLEASESIGPIPHRLWAVALGAWIASSLALAAFRPEDDFVRAVVQWAHCWYWLRSGCGGCIHRPSTA
jgi:hypothetical protein